MRMASRLCKATDATAVCQFSPSALGQLCGTLCWQLRAPLRGQEAMSMVFPGMDPYLEDPQVWPDVHASLIVYLREHLRPLLRPRYIVAIESRVFVEGPASDRPIIPDAWVRPTRPEAPDETAVLLEADPAVEVQVLPLEVEETYLTIRDRQSGQRLVTVIEVVSPTNKYAGPGRESYVAKQTEIRRSTAHLVEIDLDVCIGCKLCVKYCPWDTIEMIDTNIAFDVAKEWTLRTVLPDKEWMKGVDAEVGEYFPTVFYGEKPEGV